MKRLWTQYTQTPFKVVDLKLRSQKIITLVNLTFQKTAASQNNIAKNTTSDRDSHNKHKQLIQIRDDELGIDQY